MFFRLRVYVVAVLVGILPFIYTLSIVALTGLAIWHSHRTVMAINFNAEFGLRDFNLIVAVVAEALVSLLLMRQVIAPGCNSQTRQELLPGDQPEFFEVVRLVADRVGSPVPEKVLVDCSAHLQADYASSLDALLRRRLRLRLGMSRELLEPFRGGPRQARFPGELQQRRERRLDRSRREHLAEAVAVVDVEQRQVGAAAGIPAWPRQIRTHRRSTRVGLIPGGRAPQVSDPSARSSIPSPS
jgi:hypothetical protein